MAGLPRPRLTGLLKNCPKYCLLDDRPDEGLYAGDIGTVVEQHDVEGLETGYSVEFFDMLGNTVAVVTVAGSFLRSPTGADRPTVRLVNSLAASFS